MLWLVGILVCVILLLLAVFVWPWFWLPLALIGFIAAIGESGEPEWP